MLNGLKRSGSTNGDDIPVRIAVVTTLAVSLVFGSLVLAATDSEETAPNASVETTGDAESIVEGMIKGWIQGPGRAFKEKFNVVWGTSLVTSKVDHRQWGKARSLAFQDAFVQAMGEYIASVRQQTSVKQVRDYFAEDIPESELRYQEREVPDSYVGRIVLKSATLTERTLDQKLAESGMNQDEIQRLTTPQKRTELAKRISRNTLNEAVGSAAGLVPIKSFEGLDDEGNSAIGVVAMYSESIRHIANQIARGEVIRPDPTRARDSITDQIARYENDELPNEFGVRVMWDEQGYPAIVSFGQWGWSPENLSKRKRAQRRKFARKQAENDARSNLTVFINASTRFTEESNVGADLEEAFNLPRGGVPEEIEETVIVDKLVEKARIAAKVDLTGYTQEKIWSARHPLLEEHELVGVVAYWSPAREDAIRKTVGKEAKHAPPKEISPKRQKNHVSGSTQSREPDPADF